MVGFWPGAAVLPAGVCGVVQCSCMRALQDSLHEGATQQLLGPTPTLQTSTIHCPPPSPGHNHKLSSATIYFFSQAQLASLSSELEASQLQLRTAQAAAAEAVTAASASAAVAAQVRTCFECRAGTHRCGCRHAIAWADAWLCDQSHPGVVLQVEATLSAAHTSTLSPLFSTPPQAAAAAELEAAHRKAAQALQAEIEVLRQQRAAGEAAQAALEGEVRAGF